MPPDDLLDALLAGDARRGRAVLAAPLRSGTPRRWVYEELVAPTLREIGYRWAAGTLSVPDEHLASETLATVLAELRPAPPRDEATCTAVVACAPGEQHVLPARLAADLLLDLGWNVLFLGASTPAGELATFVVRHAPTLLVLTATRRESVAGAGEVAAALAAAGSDAAILVGGAGVEAVGPPAGDRVERAGQHLGDVVDVAKRLAAERPRAPSAPHPSGLADEVEAALAGPGIELTINELCARCGATPARVGVALRELERVRRVRSVGSRWAAGAPRSPRREGGSPWAR